MTETHGHEILNRCADRLGRGAAKHLAGGVIEHADTMLLVDCDDGVHCRLDKASEAALAFDQRLFGAFLLADIADDGGVASEFVLLVAHRRLADRDVQSPAVACEALGDQIGRNFAGLEHCDGMVSFVQQFWRRQYALATNGLSRGITKHAFRGVVPGNDFSI